MTRRRSSKAATILRDRVLRPFERGDAGVLRRRVDAGVAVDREPHDVLDQRLRPHREAEPPAGHGVGLGPAVEQDQPVADLGIAQEALVLAPAVEHLAVDLVRHDGDVGVLRRGRRPACRPRSAGTAPPVGLAGLLTMIRRVRGVICGQHLVGREGEPVLLLQRDRHRLGAGALDQRAVDREARVRDT